MGNDDDVPLRMEFAWATMAAVGESDTRQLTHDSRFLPLVGVQMQLLVVQACFTNLVTKRLQLKTRGSLTFRLLTMSLHLLEH